MKNIYGLITVRSGSSRLPRKCFLPLGNKTVIESVIIRCLNYEIVPIICTTISRDDDELEALAKNMNIKVFRGSIKNKMQRWSKCAEFYSIVDFHTIDADDPFFDGDLILKSIELRRKSNLDFVKPSIYSSKGAGSVGYSIKSSYLKSIIGDTKDNIDTEMIDKFIKSDKNCTYDQVEEKPSLDHQIRLTLDYEEDYWLISSIVRILGHFPDRKKIIELLSRNPDLYKINFYRNNEWSKIQQNIISSQIDLKNK